MIDLTDVPVSTYRRVNFGRINDAALVVLASLLTRWLPGGKVEGCEYVARNPRRADQHSGSFKVNLRTGRWADFATGDSGGDPVSLAAFWPTSRRSRRPSAWPVCSAWRHTMPDGHMFEPLAADEQAAAVHGKPEAQTKRPIIPVPASAAPQKYRHPQYGSPTAQWEYRLAGGELAGYACRFDFVRDDGSRDKAVLPVTYCDLEKRGFGWVAKGIPAPRPLYRLPEIIAHRGVPKIVCEGEKAAEAAARLFPDYVATTPMHGAKSPHKTDWTPLAGEPVIIWPDNDNAGGSFAQQVAMLARQTGASAVGIVEVPTDWPKKWDLADPLPDGVDPAVLRHLLTEALERAAQPEPTPGPEYVSVGPYEMSERGLYYHVPGKKDAPPIWLSGPFEVLAQTRDPHSSQWGLLLRWSDPDGRVHEWAMPKEALGGGRDEIWRALLREGLDIKMSTANQYLSAYLAQVRPAGRACGLSRIGWHSTGGRMVFVLPNATYGDTGRERVLWQTEARNDTLYNIAGDLDGWRQNVAARCAGNSRLVFSVSAAFAPPLLPIVDEESGGFHLKGKSRAGKTVALRAAGSVWGGGVLGFARTWRATANGLEGIAEAHNHALLCLDEMGQVDAKEAGEIAYMLANGTGKGRAGRNGSPRRSAQWQTMFLSTGELSLADKMAEIGKMLKAGQEVRLVEIPADAGADVQASMSAGLGGIDRVTEMAGPADHRGS